MDVPMKKVPRGPMTKLEQVLGLAGVFVTAFIAILGVVGSGLDWLTPPQAVRVMALGGILGAPKCSQQPQTEIDYIGFSMRTTAMTVHLTERSVEKMEAAQPAAQANLQSSLASIPHGGVDEGRKRRRHGRRLRRP